MIHVEHQQELKWIYKTKEFNRDDYYVPGNHLVVSFQLTQGVGREGCPGPSLYPRHVLAHGPSYGLGQPIRNQQRLNYKYGRQRNQEEACRIP
jgi:hypothetical protein